MKQEKEMIKEGMVMLEILHGIERNLFDIFMILVFLTLVIIVK